MNVLVIGSGAREHAIAWKLAQSPRVRDIYVAPGNAGTAPVARNLPIQESDTNGLLRAARDNGIHLTIVGPEVPLAEGIVDTFQEQHMPIFGPTRNAARIESSKSFAKDLMQRHGVPCAQSQTFDRMDAAMAYIAEMGLPIVIKADGLAAGKGVAICFTHEEATTALEDSLVRRTFGMAGAMVVVEEYLEGPEASLLAFCDGKTVLPMTPAADYKRAYDYDQGPNTGGMGAYSPPPYFGQAQVDEAKRTILEPIVHALAEEGSPFVGVLFAGLMVTSRGLRVLEFNCRFGDPETQVVLPRLKTDLLSIVEACLQGQLDTITLEWDSQVSVGVVVASEGYPREYKTGYGITGLDQLADGIRVFHSGTATRPMQDRNVASVEERLGGDIVTAGGRVLTVVAMGPTLETTRERVYQNVYLIRFEGAFSRRDIGIPSGSAASAPPIAVSSSEQPAT